MASRGIRTNEEGIKGLKTELESLKTEINGEVNGEMIPNIGNKIRRINRSIGKIEDEGETPMTSNLDMGNKRILNLPPPRDSEESTETYNDPVTVKYLYDLLKDIAGKIRQNIFEKKEVAGKLKVRLHMSQHRINDLADPVEYDDAVTKRYVATRFQAPTDSNSEMQSVTNIAEAYNKIFVVIDNQMLLLKYDRDGWEKWEEVHRSSLELTFLS